MSEKRSNAQRTHSMQGVFVFVLLGLFAVMSTLMVLLGAQMYRGTVDATAANNGGRVLNAYVRSMIRAEDTAGSLAVERYGDTTVLAMREALDDEEYVTWIYLHNGQLYEQFTSAGYAFDPEMGTPICGASAFEPELVDGLLTVRMMDGVGQPSTVQVALRCAQ